MYALRLYEEHVKVVDFWENMNFLFGYNMATTANYGPRKLSRRLTPHDFFKFKSIDDTAPSYDELIELMSRPEIMYRFKKKKDG